MYFLEGERQEIAWHPMGLAPQVSVILDLSLNMAMTHAIWQHAGKILTSEKQGCPFYRIFLLITNLTVRHSTSLIYLNAWLTLGSSILKLYNFKRLFTFSFCGIYIKIYNLLSVMHKKQRVRLLFFLVEIIVNRHQSNYGIIYIMNVVL